MRKYLRVGESTYDVGSPRVIQGFFATIAQNLEPEGRGSRFPLIMSHLFDGWLDPADATAALRELEEIDRELAALTVGRVVQSPPAKFGQDNRLWCDRNARNVREYFVGTDGRPLIAVLFEAVGRSRERNEPALLQTPFNRQMPPWLRGALMVYSLAAIVYLMVGAFSQTGLAGYLMALEFNVTGYASDRISVLLGLMVLLIPMALVEGALEHWAPGLFRKHTRAAVVTRPFVLSWKAIWLTTLLLILTGAGITGFLAYQANAELRADVYEIDLSGRTAALPPQATLVALTGVLARDHVTGIAEGQRASVYVPIVGRNWRSNDPIQYIVHYESHHVDEGNQPQLPDAFRMAGPARFPGKLTRTVPVAVRQQYRSEGLKIAPTVQVIDWKELPDGRVPASGQFDDVWLSGVLSGLIVLLIFPVLVKVRRTQMQLNPCQHPQP